MEKFLVSASTGAMTSLLGKLGTMLTDEYKLLKDVGGDIESLKKELEAMQAFLVNMADVEKPDCQAKIRVDAVRELSYDIEDKIDKFMVLVDGHEPSSKSDVFRELLDKIKDKIWRINTRHKIAKDVKDIKTQVDEISKRYKRYKIDGSSKPRNVQVDPRLRAVYEDASKLVGIDGPRDELVKWLNGEEGESAHQLKVVSIVGSGGLGKTTLAKQVYDKLGANFECRAFVSISRSPDMKEILISILSQLRNKDCAPVGAGGLQHIIDQIRNFLEDKRYFIVIDDLWDIQTWKRSLKCVFVENNRGSRVMTTTRKADVAKSCCSSHEDLIHKIKPLNDADSKKLFFKRIFNSEESCPPNFKEVSKDILKKCSGLPLAINAISSLLASHSESKEAWERVRCSIGFAQGKYSDVDAMDYILSLSYFDLPIHLRSCLLYLTMFPEDYKVDRERLVHRWICEGFIHVKDRGDLVELGEAYFHELVNRSLIQPVDIGYDGKASGCRVHDTVLDFLIYKSTQENFCTILSNHSEPGSNVQKSKVRKIRRLSLMGNVDQASVEKLDLSHCRSLAVFGNFGEYLHSLGKSNALRVLDLSSCYGLKDDHVKDIGRFLQLRYLNISCYHITKLPGQIGDLVYLEVLVAPWLKLDELPESVTRLKRLAHLSVGHYKLPDAIGNMDNLQELGDINLNKQSLKFLEELGKLTNLRNLRIEWDYSKESDEASYKGQALVSSLHKLDTCKLQRLHIRRDLKGKDATLMGNSFFPALSSIREIFLWGGELCWVTEWLVSLINLENLNTESMLLEQQDIDMIGSIPTLLKFCINCNYLCIIISGGFQQLKQLEVVVLPDSVLMFEAGAMPNLNGLMLYIETSMFKSGGDSFDMGIQHLSSLAWLTVEIIHCVDGAAEMESAQRAFRTMADALPNRPTLEMRQHYFRGHGTS